jgi:hypothetical protein
MKIQTYATERGARAFEKRVQALWPNLITRVCCTVGLDFRDKWYVEAHHPSKYGKWLAVGPISRKAIQTDANGNTHGLANLKPSGIPRQ